MKPAKCLIFGAAMPAYLPPSLHDETETSFVIAADGGLDALKEIGIKPDLIVGDLDSLKTSIPPGSTVIKHPVEKDETDTMLAVRLGEEQGCEEFALYGCLGGERFDHALATMQVLTYLARKKKKVTAYYPTPSGKAGVVTAISGESEITLPARTEGGIFSVLSADGQTEGVNISGAKYTLVNAVLKPYEPLGVSNEFLPDVPATVSVKRGTLWIMFDADTEHSL